MSVWDKIFNFDDYGELLALLHNSILAGALLGLVGGLIGVFVMMRDLTFAVHGISELSFAGASFALLIGVNVVARLDRRLAARRADHRRAGRPGPGTIVDHRRADAVRARPRRAVPGALPGAGGEQVRPAHRADRGRRRPAAAAGWRRSRWSCWSPLAIMWRPLMFATVDPEIAAARGVPVRALSPIFMLVLGLTVAMAVQVVGALLVLSLLVTPAAAAMRVTASALWVPVLSVIFAMVSVVGGILLALGGSLPISPYVTTISFAI